MTKIIADDISVICDRFLSIKCLSITKILASIQMLTDVTYLTYLPDLTIDEKLE